MSSAERFRKRPVEIEAMQLLPSNEGNVASWCGSAIEHVRGEMPTLSITTLEGVMLASMGDWIVKGVKGEFYPVREDIFYATYEKVETQ